MPSIHYKGFLIVCNVNGVWFEKGGVLIDYAKSEDDAREQIDTLVIFDADGVGGVVAQLGFRQVAKESK